MEQELSDTHQHVFKKCEELLAGISDHVTYAAAVESILQQLKEHKLWPGRTTDAASNEVWMRILNLIYEHARLYPSPEVDQDVYRSIRNAYAQAMRSAPHDDCSIDCLSLYVCALALFEEDASVR